MTVSKFHQISLEGRRGVLIDLDDTLYAYDPAHEQALRRVHSDCLSEIPFADFSTLYRAARNRVMQELSPQGVCRSRLLAFLHVFEDLGAPYAYVRAHDADEIYWNTFIEAMCCSPSARSFLDRCVEAQVPVCVVSDMTTHIQIRKLEKLGVAGQIAHLVTSESVGVEKPDPRMFLEGMRKLAMSEPRDVIMIGDSRTKDIEGAERLGIAAYLISLAES